MLQCLYNYASFAAFRGYFEGGKSGKMELIQWIAILQPVIRFRRSIQNMKAENLSFPMMYQVDWKVAGISFSKFLVLFMILCLSQNRELKEKIGNKL